LPELSGYVLNHYVLGKVLGTNATGAIFRARDLKTGLVVALRIISPEFPANEAEMQPFIKTLRLVLPLRHRNLVSMWNAGRTIPYCWLAVDYVEGENLASILTQLNPPGKFAWQYALHIGLHVARALNYVHRQKLAHGNVTPANILIRQADKIVKLGDLMLFKALEGSALGRFVRGQTLKGDLPYFAPEQAIPNPRVDALTDIYSLGACLFARCTGQPVVQGRTVEEIVEQIHHGPMVRPRQYQSGIPDAFDDAVGKMLARRREDRYQSAADVVADLESIAEAEGVEV
jgi:serine/threonine-protein kinase